MRVWLDPPVGLERRQGVIVLFAVLAIAAVVYVPGGLFLVVAIGFVLGIRYALTALTANPTRDRRIAAGVAVAIGTFLGVGFAWLVVLVGMTYECEFEEVRCSDRAEYLAANGDWTFVPIAVFALAAGWFVARPRR